MPSRMNSHGAGSYMSNAVNINQFKKFDLASYFVQEVNCMHSLIRTYSYHITLVIFEVSFSDI